MYNFKLMDNEEVIKIFDEILIKQGENEKDTIIILTNERLLFLDYTTLDEGLEVLRVARGTDYIKYKDVYYQINLNDIENISRDKYYQVVLKKQVSFEFDNEELYNLLRG